MNTAKHTRYWLVVVALACALAGGDCTSGPKVAGSLPSMPAAVVDRLEPGTIIGGIQMTDAEAMVMAHNEGWMPAEVDTSWYEWMNYLPAKNDSISGRGMWMCEERQAGAWPTPSGCTNFYILWSVAGGDTTGHMIMIRIADDRAMPIWTPRARAYEGD